MHVMLYNLSLANMFMTNTCLSSQLLHINLKIVLYAIGQASMIVFYCCFSLVINKEFKQKKS